ncbi:MAG: hypothetical protein GXO57_04120 [Thermodesulfobacteria bacterium]|nr:hypothetical protein [Thermodesulfobacteriota bacterium]
MLAFKRTSLIPILLVLLILNFGNLALSQSLNEKVLKACGYGRTIKEARLNALKFLSSQILTQVEAQEVLTKKLKQHKLFKSFFSRVKLKTQAYLKGVKYSPPTKSDEFYEVCAYFTSESFVQTFKFLTSKLNIDLTSLSPSELKKAQKEAYFLLSLGYAFNNTKTIKFALNKLRYIYELLNYCRLIVVTIPKNAKVIVNETPYPSGKLILLPPNRLYLIKVVAEGYRPKEFSLYAFKGEKISKLIELQKVFKNPVKICITSNDSLTKKLAIEFLVNSNVNPVSCNATKYRLELELHDDKLTIDQYRRHLLTLVIRFYEHGALKRVIKGKLKPFFTFKNYNDTLYQTKLKLLINTLLCNFLNSNFT